MTTVNNTTPPAAANSAAQASGLTSAAEQTDRFMKLLVAQMQNQDPLNPMDNAQMTTQIAQINTVAGIEKLNSTVTSLLSQFAAMQGQQSLQLAGREVLVDGNSLELANGQAVAGVNLPADATSVNVQVVDAIGTTVKTISLGALTAGAHAFAWDGSLDNGNTAPDGEYAFRITAASGGTAVNATTLKAAHVNAVTPTASGTNLDLGAAGIVPTSAVKSYL